MPASKNEFICSCVHVSCGDFSMSCSFATKYFLCVAVKKRKNAFLKRDTISRIESRINSVSPQHHLNQVLVP